MRRYAVLALAQAAIGAAAIFARFALTGAAPLAVAASRLVIASAVLLAVAAMRSDWKKRAASPRERAIFIAAGISLAIHFGAWMWSLQFTSVAISTLLVSTAPIWTALYDALFHRRRLARGAWAAFAIGAAGLVLVVGARAEDPPIPGHQALGAALALSGGLAIALYFLLVREVTAAFPTGPIVTRTYTVAALALTFAALAARQGPPAAADGTAWAGILAMALVSQLLGHTALNASLRWFSPSAVAFTSLVEPVAAGALAFLILGERLTWWALAGGTLIFAAIALFLVAERRLVDRSTAGIGSVL